MYSFCCLAGFDTEHNFFSFSLYIGLVFEEIDRGLLSQKCFVFLILLKRAREGVVFSLFSYEGKEK